MITKKQIDNVVRKIVDNYHPDKVILFGSYANGTPNEDSDVDLFIIKNSNKPFFERLHEVRRFLGNTEIPLDIMVYSNDEYNEKKTWVNHIAYIVTKEGRTVYER